jgi:MFS family permease
MNKNRFSISLLFFLCGLNFASWATRIPDFKETLSLSDAALGTVLMGLPIGSMVSLPLAGWLISKFESAYICLVAVILYILILPLFGFISSPIQLFLSLFAFGMAGDILNIAMNTQVVSLESILNKIVMSSFHAIFSVGLMLGAFIGGYLIKYNISLQDHFLFISLANLVGIPLFYKGLLADGFKTKSDEKPEKVHFFKIGKYLMILSFIAFGGMLCEGAMADWITLYVIESAAKNPFPITIGFTSFAFAMVVGRFIGDYLSNRFEVRSILIFNGLSIALGISIGLMSTNIYLIILGCAVAGLGISTIVPIIYSKAGTAKNMSPSMALASVSTIAYVGFLLGPVLIGFLSEYFGLKSALTLLILLGVIISILSKYYLTLGLNTENHE